MVLRFHHLLLFQSRTGWNLPPEWRRNPENSPTRFATPNNCETISLSLSKSNNFCISASGVSRLQKGGHNLMPSIVIPRSKPSISHNRKKWWNISYADRLYFWCLYPCRIRPDHLLLDSVVSFGSDPNIRDPARATLTLEGRDPCQKSRRCLIQKREERLMNKSITSKRGSRRQIRIFWRIDLNVKQCKEKSRRGRKWNTCWWRWWTSSWKVVIIIIFCSSKRKMRS